MIARHDSIGIKQVLRLDWMQKAVNLKRSRIDPKSARASLHEYLEETIEVATGESSSLQTRKFAVNNLMNIWFPEEQGLFQLSDALATMAGEKDTSPVALHWAMTSAVYPFWHNVAKQAGRLLSLQDQVTQSQIVKRLKEQYGDRQTVSRYARFVIRSFVDWGVLKDATRKGCYEMAASISISSPKLYALLIESSLLAVPEYKSPLGQLQVHPAFFPYTLPVMTGDQLSRINPRLNVVRYGLDDELLCIKTIR